MAGRNRAVRVVVTVVVTICLLVAIWEGYKWFGQQTNDLVPGTGIELPVSTDDLTMPHALDIVGELAGDVRDGRNTLPMTLYLLKKAWFTLQEAAIGFTLGLVIGLALAGTMSIAGASASASVDQQIEDSFVGDYVVTNVFGGPFSPSVAEALVDVEGVDRVAVERYDVARLEGDFVFVGAVSGEDLDLLGLELLDGSRPPSGDREGLLAEQGDDANDAGARIEEIRRRTG